MKDLTTSIMETVKTWSCAYDKEGNIDRNETLLRIITEMAWFASEMFLPNLYPLIEAVCAYGKSCENQEKVSQAMEALKDLMELQNTIHTYSYALNVLEVAHDSHQSSLRKEAVAR